MGFRQCQMHDLETPRAGMAYHLRKKICSDIDAPLLLRMKMDFGSLVGKATKLREVMVSA